MSSELLGSAQNVLKGNLGGAWDITNGYQDAYTDLGIARRFGAAAAAYSLRDIGAMNGRVVKVRRDVDGDGTDKEEDFSANQVQSGALEDWVNGKLETTLPADVATAAAAYSLRKVKASYSGNAVRIRRSSDDIEVDVAFDSDGKVSASSAITNVAEQGGESGSTTATDLNGFLNESTENFSAIAYADINSDFKQFTSTPTISDTAISGSTGSVDALSARLGFKLPSQLTISDYSGLKIKVTGTVNSFTSDENLVISPSKVANGGTTFTPPEGGKVITSGTTGNFEFIFTGDTTNTFQSVVFKFGDNSSFDISNLKFEIIEHGATVHTWYDQAGSNDAVQATAANQPQIAENGALLADGVTFDGTNDFLQTSGQVLTNVYTGGRSLYGVCKINTDSGYIFGDAGSGTDEGTSFYSDTASDKIFFTNGKSGTLTTFDNITTIEGSNFLISSNYNNNNATTIHKNSNNNGYTQGTGSYNFGTSPKFTIGDREGGSSAATRFDGSVQEIIAYDSDQSDNRFKIESNINNYYGLYNDANAFSANAQVDGTGSTVSNASKDGGTLTLSSASGNNYLYFQLTETVPATSGDIFISFNYESSDDSVNLNNVKLRDDADSAKSGDLVDSSGSAITIQKNGFYSGKLASANLTNTGTRLAFLTNQTTDGYTFTISNLRYSRIARNGLVETWYDQSGNGRDATQGTAANQPAIVQNGGLSSDGLDFDGSNDLLDITNSLPITGANARSVFAVVNKDVSSSSDNILGIGDNGSGVNSQLWNLATTYGLYYNGGNTVFGAGSLNTEQLITAIYPSTATDSGDTVLFIDGSASSITSNVDTTLATDNTIARIGSGGGSAGGLLDGSLKEIIVFDSDKLSDRTDIEQDIKNFYNI